MSDIEHLKSMGEFVFVVMLTAFLAFGQLYIWPWLSSTRLFQQLEALLGPRIVKRTGAGDIFVRRKNRDFVQVEPKGDDLLEFNDEYNRRCTRSIDDFVTMIKEENKTE